MSPERSSIKEQAAQFEQKRRGEDEEALNKLLDELESSLRDLSEAEVAFLRRQSDRIEEALAKPHEDGIEVDDLNVTAEKIGKLLGEKE